MIRVEDELAPTRLTLVILLPSMNMIIALEPLRTTGWTRLSHDHSALLPPCSPQVFWLTIPQVREHNITCITLPTIAGCISRPIGAGPTIVGCVVGAIRWEVGDGVGEQIYLQCAAEVFGSLVV
jgi:hypothetical protein